MAIVRVHRVGDYLRASDGRSRPLTPWVDTFVLGTTEPVGGTNVGAGVFEARPFPTQVVELGGGVSFAGSTYTVAAGVVVEDRVFPGFVNLEVGARLVNCRVSGPASEVATVRALVQGPADVGQALVDFCTIDPTTASAYYDGIGRGIKATRSWVKNVTDGIRGFSTATAGARTRCEGVLVDQLAQFAPDYVNSRAETHNDGAQLQGNPNGDVNDIFFDGCKINARHSLTKGNPLPPYRAQIAALMLTPNVGTIHMTFTRGWLLGGIYCVNAGSNTLAGCELVLTGTRFERPGTDLYGDGRAPNVALAVDASLSLTHSGNTYIDNGAAVTPTNA